MTNLRHLLRIILVLLLLLLALFPILTRRQLNRAPSAGGQTQNTPSHQAGQLPQPPPAIPGPAKADLFLRAVDQQPADPATAERKFEILNSSPSTAVFPDTWFLLFEDGSITNLSLTQTGNIRVEPGQKGTIAIARPATKNPWRLGGNYYLEDTAFRVKVALDQSALKSHLPDSASSVQGKNVLSDWIK